MVTDHSCLLLRSEMHSFVVRVKFYIDDRSSVVFFNRGGVFCSNFVFILK
jgi:hypothetical protein